MMENHSFSNIAGYWDFHPEIDNLRNRKYCNEYTNPNWTVWGEPLDICAGPYETEVPLEDPDHEFAGVTYQIYRKWNVTNDDVPNMGGFIERQSEKYQATPGESAFVIKAYDEKKSSTLAEIAQNFAFWDSYVRILRNLETMIDVTDGTVCGTPWTYQSEPSICYVGLDLWIRG
ncbi:unnamed protein product [Aspergillus oryzae]|uniref:Unnamed protein product n=2 Tax=Aspergillus oryzae TaxID=5062 RepID=A0AAN4YC12_ASPOZ|nr:unnamed protein product [Aspergillus oryzae]GMF85783.1 unnamed protein product [Aspergillus oryzae]GMG01289.1 unnamed protein product [Aspergillus oryzae]GMG27230.1 unnamed protein product [Aspergillus oryzae]GMG51784.1 unnamed protein product [Aspergillus oryzae var. brunneus]